MRTLSLFSGIGGMDLGLERAGFEIVAQCEREPFCRAVLAKHWPGVPCFDDVRTIDPDAVGQVDCVCGGFPCQDVSVAGKGAGVDAGERSGLWREMFRVIDALRPRWVIAENVPALRTRGADRVLGDLEEIGYASWPIVVGASHVGAPHKRHRVFIVAYAEGRGRSDAPRADARELREAADASQGRTVQPGGRRPVVGHAAGGGAGAVPAGQGEPRQAQGHADGAGEGLVGYPHGHPLRQQPGRCGRTGGTDQTFPGWPSRPGNSQHAWEAPRVIERPVGRAADGASIRLVRASNRHALRGFGNAVVPQVAELIGAAVKAADQALRGAHA